MKNKIVLFVIGILIGAVIATGSFYVYTTINTKNNNDNNNTQMNGGQPPEIPNGQNSENGQSSEKPSDDSTQSITQQNTN